jgi:two-component sensor histidine kinase
MRAADLLVGQDERGFQRARHYLMAFGAIAVALCLQSILAPIQQPFPLLFYVPAICLATLYGGLWPGIFAAGLSALCVLGFASAPALRELHDWRGVAPWVSYTLVWTACILALNAIRDEIVRLRRQNEDTAVQLQDADVRVQALRHQMANNMQVVASLLTLQKMKLKTDPWAAASLLDDARQRVVDISRISRRLSERATAATGFQQYLQLLCTDLQSSRAVSSHEIVSSVSDDFDISDPGKLMALSVLIGEAVNNALKHAFREPRGGMISVALKRIATSTGQLIVQDSGRGLPEGIDIAAAKTGGFLVMRAMTVQLGGTIETPPAPQGTVLVVTFAV